MHSPEAQRCYHHRYHHHRRPHTSRRVLPLAARLLQLAVIGAALSGAQPAFAQSQSAALEYYVQPDFAGVNALTVSAGGLSLVNDLTGVTLSFNTGGFFRHELVSQTAIDFAANIDVSIPGFAGRVPAVETELSISDGSYRISTPQGEIIEGDVGAGSVVRLVPYPSAPRVLFYELRLLPLSTQVTPPQSLTLSMDAITTWGFIVTDGVGFAGAFGNGQNQQYEASAEF